MTKEYKDIKGRTIKIYITDEYGCWVDRRPPFIVPIGNYIGSIQFGENAYGGIASMFYAGFDSDIDPEAVVIWERINGSQMQDDIDRGFLRAAIFIDEQEDRFYCDEPYLPYAAAGVCAIVESYLVMFGEDTYSLEMNHFKDEFLPFVTAIYKEESIPAWEEDSEEE